METLSPLLKSCSLGLMRVGQNMIGDIIKARNKKDIIIHKHEFKNFTGAWVIPKDERRDGVILYLHGGGYTCGGLDYALGFGSAAAAESGTKVFCCAYRLAPENRYPAALDDAYEAYSYLIEKGYSPSRITLAGESAGGGLCYALCLKLREKNMQMPCGIVAVSPWTDMTASGSSYQTNISEDPSMTAEQLDFFAKSYTENRTDPLVSPVFADLRGMPPSIIFAAKNEIMFSDANLMHMKLLDAGCESVFYSKPERWHAYIVYMLEEDRDDIERINRFLNKHMSVQKKQKWFRLDNAAKIYPAARRKNWSNVFRLSITLKDDVDKNVLQSALDVTVRRFPSIAARLRKGMFWYYLQSAPSVPQVDEEKSYPLTEMSKRATRKCAFRVLYYKNRIAVEMFHSLTDGTGALIFLKTLTAEYFRQKYGELIPAENGVLDRFEHPSQQELEDSFRKYAGKISASRKENDAWLIKGTPENDGFLNLTCFRLQTKQVLDKAHEYGVSLTVFMCSVLMMALSQMQKEKVASQKRRKPIKVLVPVNLRNLFESRSLRNFALYTTPEILPALGDYTLEEICEAVNHKMGLEVTKKQMSMKIAANVNSEKLMAVRIMPLFIKDFVMKAVYDTVGEKKSCINFSNLGLMKLPAEMDKYVERADFILGAQAKNPYNCSAISYKETLYMNFIRNIKENELEVRFYEILKDLGIDVEAESNLSSR
jgi:acetyl esterase/lipase/NRPS condensation-like uncharacterized protein